MIDLDEALRGRGDRWRAAQRPAPDLDSALDRLAPRRRRTGAVLAVAASVLLIAAAAVAWLRPTSTQPAGEDQAPVEVIAAARSVARADGDPNPNRIAVVASTYADAADVLDGLVGQPSDDSAIWVVEMTGDFVCDLCSRPSGGSSPQGDVLSIIVRADNYEVTDFGLENRWVDLGPLGEVHELVPAPDIPSSLAEQVLAIDGIEDAEVVRTTWVQAHRLIPTDLPDPSEHVWVVQAHGTFDNPSLGGPIGDPGTPAPSVASVALLVHAESPQGNVASRVLFGRVGGTVIDLNALGPVTTIRP